MRATLNRTDLLRALSRVRGALSPTDIPALSAVLLAVADGRLALACTDLALHVRDSLPAAEAQGGSAAVPAEMFYDVVRRLPDMAQVLLEGGEGCVTVRAGRSRFRLPALPADEFPTFQAQPGGAATFTVPGADLARLIDGALYAAAREDPRRYLLGLYLAPAGDVLRAAATDGRRLAQVDAPLPVGAEAAPPVTLPHGACAVVLGAIGGNQGPKSGDDCDVVATVARTLVTFAVGTTVIITKLVDGEFPDTSRVIPLANEWRFEANRAAFLGAVGRVQAVARDHCVRLELRAGGVALRVRDEVTGAEAEEELTVDYDGDEAAVGLNSRMLMEAVEHVEGELVRVSIDDDRTPVLVEGVEDAGSLHVVMPMRLP